MVSTTRLGRAALTGYLLGTIPSADLAAKAALGRSGDLRSEGTGNPGAANAAMVLGAKWGAAVMIADIAKGAAASAQGRRAAGDLGAHVGGVAAIAGHCWPVWNGFRGGKGVATSVGQCLMTFPVYLPIDLTVAVATAMSPRWKARAEAATAAASATWVLSSAVWAWRKWPNLWGPAASPALPAAALASSAMVLRRFASEREQAGRSSG
ncbi:MAG: glycerol-3-phosphate acyltransferase [Acidimicrobiales bacterium]